MDPGASERQSVSATGALEELAGALGIATSYWDAEGKRCIPPAETLGEIAGALGFPARDEAAARASLDRLGGARRDRLLPPVLVVPEDQPTIPIEIDLASRRSLAAPKWRVVEESGRGAEGSDRRLLPGTGSSCRADCRSAITALSWKSSRRTKPASSRCRSSSCRGAPSARPSSKATAAAGAWRCSSTASARGATGASATSPICCSSCAAPRGSAARSSASIPCTRCSQRGRAMRVRTRRAAASSTIRSTSTWKPSGNSARTPPRAPAWAATISSAGSRLCAPAIGCATSRSRPRRRRSCKSSTGISGSDIWPTRAIRAPRRFANSSGSGARRSGASRSSRGSPRNSTRRACTPGSNGRRSGAIRRRRRWRGSSAKTSSASNTTSTCSGWWSSSSIGCDRRRARCIWASGSIRISRWASMAVARRSGKTAGCSPPA